MVDTAKPTPWKTIDFITDACAIATLFFAFGVAYCIVCPPDPARHVAAHSAQLPIFAKSTIRAGRL